MRLIENKKLGSATIVPNLVFSAYFGSFHKGLSSPMPCA
jgi:hypothetical protein